MPGGTTSDDVNSGNQMPGGNMQGGRLPDGNSNGQMPEGMTPPTDNGNNNFGDGSQGQMTPPDGFELPEGMEQPDGM